MNFRSRLEGWPQAVPCGHPSRREHAAVRDGNASNRVPQDEGGDRLTGSHDEVPYRLQARAFGASTFRLPSGGRQLKSGERKSRRDRAAEQRPVAEALRRLPGARRHDGLRLLAGGEVAAEPDSLDRRRDLAAISSSERRAGVEVPDLGGIDAVPMRALAARQQEIDRGRGGAAARPSRGRGRSRESGRLRDAA